MPAVKRALLEPALRPSGVPQEAVDTIPHANTSFLGVFPQKDEWGGQGVAISGFEDHSVSVMGNDQIVTYDDSNVFVERSGQINTNTGDTDSSGLNVVDVTHSRIRSGNSGDAEGNGDEEDEEVEDEEDAAVEEPVVLEGEMGGLMGEPRVSRQVFGMQLPSEANPSEGDPDPEEGDEEKVPLPYLEESRSFATVTDEGASIAIGKQYLRRGSRRVRRRLDSIGRQRPRRQLRRLERRHPRHRSRQRADRRQ
ncbi:MAG: hypothetical protein GEU90_04185 [Gemmatimonas sp.]|nr:hypothetical protein [Gemmatimonas sp.]